MIRLALSNDDFCTLADHFGSAAPQETGTFLLLRSAKTARGLRLVASRPYMPARDEWEIAGSDQLRPSARLISKMISRANAERCGLLFVHSHPDPDHPTDFSFADWSALRSLSKVLPGLLDGPFAAAVAGPAGWVGSVFHEGAWRTINRITAAGRTLLLLDPPTEVGPDALDDRNIGPLAPVQERVRGLDVVVIAVGGLGSPLAETLVRMGVQRLSVMDSGRLDTPSNVRRVFGSRLSHLEAAPPKADVVGDHCRDIGLPCAIVQETRDVRHESSLKFLLDADILFCGTDSHSSRALINAVAYAFNLPVIDGGTRVGGRAGDILTGLIAEVRIIGPGLPCLWCLGILDADRIRVENLPAEQRRKLLKEGYIPGMNEVEPSVTALTVFGAGAMASALLAMLSPDGMAAPGLYRFDAFLGDSPNTTATVSVQPDCVCRAAAGRGMDAALGLIPDPEEGE